MTMDAFLNNLEALRAIHSTYFVTLSPEGVISVYYEFVGGTSIVVLGYGFDHITAMRDCQRCR